jgi:hypothetical protein
MLSLATSATNLNMPRILEPVNAGLHGKWMKEFLRIYFGNISHVTYN